MVGRIAQTDDGVFSCKTQGRRCNRTVSAGVTQPLEYTLFAANWQGRNTLFLHGRTIDVNA